MREFVQALWNWKNLEKHLYFCPFWMPTKWGGIWVAYMKNIWKHVNFWPTSMPTTWEVSLARKFFGKTPSQNPAFAAIGEGVLSLSMYLDNFIPIHLVHSSLPEPGGRAPWPIYASDNHGPQMPDNNRQGDDGGGRTMILLKRAGRKRRGETPMDPIRCRALDESRAHGGEVK